MIRVGIPFLFILAAANNYLITELSRTTDSTGWQSHSISTYGQANV